MDTKDSLDDLHIPDLAEKVQVHTLINPTSPPTDPDIEDLRLGRITMENTRLNADRDNPYREQIQDHVRSGNGHLIARGFATSQEELDFITQSQPINLGIKLSKPISTLFHNRKRRSNP